MMALTAGEAVKECKRLLECIREEAQQCENYLAKKDLTNAERRADEIENISAELKCFINDARQ